MRFKHGNPGHPQTQGKIERHHRTLKKRLGKQPKATSLDDLNGQLAEFMCVYNTERPTVRSNAGPRPRHTGPKARPDPTPSSLNATVSPDSPRPNAPKDGNGSRRCGACDPSAGGIRSGRPRRTHITTRPAPCAPTRPCGRPGSYQRSAGIPAPGDNTPRIINDRAGKSY
ncbi:integrase core domain-containing protein [Bifidobacterium longum]|uniref:integrase core domain-containing protein n=1 Tax=Bifidobacterium longum TaxID=216816 RepID=UPI00345EB0AB